MHLLCFDEDTGNRLTRVDHVVVGFVRYESKMLFQYDTESLLKQIVLVICRRLQVSAVECSRLRRTEGSAEVGKFKCCKII